MKKIIISLGNYWVWLSVMAGFLYALAAPNLILSGWEPYWQWQLWMWKTFFNNRQLLSQSFILICACIMGSYWWLLDLLWNSRSVLRNWLHHKPWQTIIIFMFLFSPLTLGMNGLSYDLFNYAFNAKIVVEYRHNPHQVVALDFPNDPWLRFMHNTHSAAPYGYGWTALSIIPYMAGWGKLLPTWLLFKLAGWLSLGLLAWWYLYIYQPKTSSDAWAIAAILFNPLLLIEVLMNGHNDLWMMVPAVASMWMIGRPSVHHKPISIKNMCWSFFLLLFSISIKLASLVLVPIWLTLVLLNHLGKIQKIGPKMLIEVKSHILIYWPTWSAIALSGLLLTERSKLFLPWYWIWILVWLPLQTPGKIRQLLQAVVFGFSCSSLLRYLPFLARGEYTLGVVSQQIVITFVGGVFLSCLWFVIDSYFFQSRRVVRDQVK